VIAVSEGKGKEHDFNIYKASKVRVNQETECIGDKGYQGIHRYHKKSKTPKKKPRKGEISKEDKRKNRELSGKRMVVEHVIRKMKIWRILSERYRNRRRRHGLRVRLIAAIYNMEIAINGIGR
jgi:Transposase DDE domain.